MKVQLVGNYDELHAMESRIVTMYLDYAKNQAKRKIPMTMEDWANKRLIFMVYSRFPELSRGYTCPTFEGSMKSTCFRKAKDICNFVY